MRQHAWATPQRGRPTLTTGITVLLTVTGVGLLLAILVQAVLAGQLLDGTAVARDWHQANASVIGFTSLAQLIIATLALLTHRAVWPVIAAAAILLAVGNQISLGNDGAVSAHVPLGVALFGAQAAFVSVLLTKRRRGAAWSRHALDTTR